jgi:sugar phosphate isomerase/epimerase
MISRQRFGTSSAPAPLGLRSATNKIPVKLELSSVRDELTRDRPGTLAAVAKMGYQVLGFYAPYFLWTTGQAKQVRKQLDDLGMRCNSIHNCEDSFRPDGLNKAIELNQDSGI